MIFQKNYLEKIHLEEFLNQEAIHSLQEYLSRHKNHVFFF